MAMFEAAQADQQDHPAPGIVSLADQRAARRLFACASAALLCGAALMALTPAQLPSLAKIDRATGAKSGAKVGVPNAAAPNPMQDAASAFGVETHETQTPSGLDVVAFLPKLPVTVRERARVRADAASNAAVVETVEPGEPLRVVGAVQTPGEGGPWLQVRYGEGEVGYIQASFAADLGRWRQAQLVERLRRQQEEAEAAARASGIDVAPDSLPGDLLGGAPMILPSLPPPENTP
jgi:hypothetical protein